MIQIDGSTLTISKIAQVSMGAKVQLSTDSSSISQVNRSSEFILSEVNAGKAIYGVTTLFGGMADKYIPPELAAQLQNNLVYHLSATAGDLLSIEDVRAALLLRANSLVKGVSGIRKELLQRFEIFLNANVHPFVHQLGSIGASGDLIPLAYIAGSLIGMNDNYKVNFDGEVMGSPHALQKLGLQPMSLLPKEGLALANGTSVCCAVAANCIDHARYLTGITMGVHALYAQALTGSVDPYDEFIHSQKPHSGQQWAATQMRRLLRGSKLTFEALHGDTEKRRGSLVQDRYSLRCLPQFLGPIIDGLKTVAMQIETEANSATDNPLIDVENERIIHGGNFLAQYVGVGMDQLRYHLGLLAKHVDVQIALLVEPSFNNGLPACLVGNQDTQTNLGLKALQTAGNSIMPLISYHGNSLVDRFPTHAEQFNQNVNSQAMGSALLTRKSLSLLDHYMANALIFAVQAVELRAKQVSGSYDPRSLLSEATLPLYNAVNLALDRKPCAERPLIWDDADQFLGNHVTNVMSAVTERKEIAAATADTFAALID